MASLGLGNTSQQPTSSREPSGEHRNQSYQSGTYVDVGVGAGIDVDVLVDVSDVDVIAGGREVAGEVCVCVRFWRCPKKTRTPHVECGEKAFVRGFTKVIIPQSARFSIWRKMQKGAKKETKAVFLVFQARKTVF